MAEEVIEKLDGVLSSFDDEGWNNIKVDSQVLSSFMGCPQKMDFMYNRHLYPMQGPSKSIQKGTLSHEGLMHYWKARIEGKDYQQASLDAIEAAKKKALKLENIDPEDGLDVFKTLIDYFKFIANKPWIPLFVEQIFRFKAYENPDEKLRIFLTGRIDLGIRTPQIPLIPVDNKSESERWFYSIMSNQFKIYAIACDVTLLGVQRFGFQKNLEPEQKFKMETLSFDPSVLDEFKNEILPYWVKEMLRCKENNYWPKNTTDCVHGHFKCYFSDAYNNGGICSVSPAVREQKILRYFSVREAWDPEKVD